MRKMSIYISATIAISFSCLHASDCALAGYVVGCLHEQNRTQNSSTAVEPKHLELGNLEKYICSNSTDPGSVKYRIPWKVFQEYFHFFLKRPNLSVTIIDDTPDDSSNEFPQSSLPSSANSSGTTLPDKQKS